MAGRLILTNTASAPLRARYDALNYADLTVSSAGVLTVAPTGGRVIIDQGAADTQALALKSSDIAHGLTGITETDVFFALTKASGTQGGLKMEVFAEDGTVNAPLNLAVLGGIADTTKTATSVGLINMGAFEHDGVGNKINTPANGNIFSLQTQRAGVDRTLLLVDAEGDLHLDATSNINAWDEHDDVALLSTFRAVTMAQGDRDAAQRWFGDFLTDERNKRVLHETGVISVTPREGGGEDVSVSIKGAIALTMDAARQLGQRLAAVERRLLETSNA